MNPQSIELSPLNIQARLCLWEVVKHTLMLRMISKNLKELEKHKRALNLILLFSRRLTMNYFIFYRRSLKRGEAHEPQELVPLLE